MLNTIEIRRHRQVARLSREGMTLIEIMIVVTIIAMIAGGVALALVPRLEEARIKSTRTDAQALRSAVTLYVADNPRSCPTVEDLVANRYLDSSRRTTDAWGTEFQIACEGGEIVVTSAGPDLEMGTEDDIQ